MEQKYAEAEKDLQDAQQSEGSQEEKVESSADIEHEAVTGNNEASAPEDNELHFDKNDYVEKSAFDEMQAKADENMQRFLRAQADLDNFRRRTRLEKADAAKYGAINLIEQLLPVLDNFERALASSETNKDFDALVKGVEIVHRQLLQALEQEGLEHINAIGGPFNPEFHQAVMQVESEEHDEGIVVEEVQKGYLLKDKVLRASMVKVSK